MAIVNMKEMLEKARAEKYAVGAFNILDFNSMKAVIECAEENRAPVIVQTSVKTVLFWDYEPMMSWFRDLAENAAVPVAIHLDHCKDPDVIQKCLDAGWTSVMIDASSKPYEENLELSAKVVRIARAYDASVEAELGAIVGVEDDIHVKEQDAHLADEEQSVRFCKAVAVDCFAPAIGTAHGVYKGKPKIDFALLEKISAETRLPIALHGGTGLSDDVFLKAIDLGCAKINISTQLKYAFIDGFAAYHQDNPKDYNPLNVIKAQEKALRQGIVENIKLFGSAGKAS